MRRLIPIALMAAAAAIVAYLFDPDRGRSRRARIADQTGARARDASKGIRAKTEYQKGVIKGVAHDITEPFRGVGDIDDDTLLQKVRSEALGYLDDHEDIEIDVNDGHVMISGIVSTDNHDRLLDLIDDVRGVRSVEDHLVVVV